MVHNWTCKTDMLRDKFAKRRCTEEKLESLSIKTKEELRKELIYLISRSTARMLGVDHQNDVPKNKLPLMMLAAQTLKVWDLTEVMAAS